MYLSDLRSLALLREAVKEEAPAENLLSRCAMPPMRADQLLRRKVWIKSPSVSVASQCPSSKWTEFSRQGPKWHPSEVTPCDSSCGPTTAAQLAIALVSSSSRLGFRMPSTTSSPTMLSLSPTSWHARIPRHRCSTAPTAPIHLQARPPLPLIARDRHVVERWTRASILAPSNSNGK